MKFEWQFDLRQIQLTVARAVVAAREAQAAVEAVAMAAVREFQAAAAARESQAMLEAVIIAAARERQAAVAEKQ